MKNKVVYFHKRNDTNEVFYVGIGNTNRPKTKENRNTHWHNVVNKVGYTVEIVHEGLTWDEACVYEVNYIKDFGRRDLGLGTLVNLTDGGEGLNNPTKETRNKIGNGKRGESYYNSKLTRKIVLEMRKLYTSGEYNQKQIGDLFNVDRRMVSGVIRRKTWKHIPMIPNEKTHTTNTFHHSKVTAEQVLEIRRLYKEGGHTHASLGKIYNVKRGTITQIINRKCWKHI